MLELLVRRVSVEELVQSGEDGLDVGMPSGLQDLGIDGPDQGLGESHPLDRNFLARLDRDGIVDEEVGELVHPWVGHDDSRYTRTPRWYSPPSW